MKTQLESLKSQLSSITSTHQREIADLEYSLKLRYEDVLKSKLKEQQAELERKFENKAKLENNYIKGQLNSERSFGATPERFPITPYRKQNEEVVNITFFEL